MIVSNKYQHYFDVLSELEIDVYLPKSELEKAREDAVATSNDYDSKSQVTNADTATHNNYQTSPQLNQQSPTQASNSVSINDVESIAEAKPLNKESIRDQLKALVSNLSDDKESKKAKSKSSKADHSTPTEVSKEPSGSAINEFESASSSESRLSNAEPSNDINHVHTGKSAAPDNRLDNRSSNGQSSQRPYKFNTKEADPSWFSDSSDNTQNSMETSQSVKLNNTYFQGSLHAKLLIVQSGNAAQNMSFDAFDEQQNGLLKAMMGAIKLPMAEVQVIRFDFTESDQNEAYHEMLDYIIQISQPKVVWLLGEQSANRILSKNDRLQNLMNKHHQYTSHLTGEEIFSIVSYDLSHLIQNPKDKSQSWKDLKQIVKLLD